MQYVANYLAGVQALEFLAFKTTLKPALRWDHSFLIFVHHAIHLCDGVRTMAETSVSSRWSLQGKTALVTGGTRGIGKAIAEELAELRATVFICSRTQRDVDNVLVEWKEKGFSVYGSVCDVSSPDACAALVQNVSQTFGGKLDILVNNAGLFYHKPVSVEYTEEETSFLMSTNFHSAFNITRLSYPYLKASGKASVVFISSVAGSSFYPDAGVAYSVSKAAMDQAAKYLACEWAKDGIRVNSVAPGAIFTGLIAEVVSKPNVAKYLEEKIPMGRHGRPEELAAVVAFLCMDCASYTTGQVIYVDGGISLN